MGMITLNCGDYLILITSKKKMATLFSGFDHDVYSITGTSIIQVSTKKMNPTKLEISKDIEFVHLLESICKMGHMYFSYTFDLTHSAQRSFTDPSQHYVDWKFADQRFLWNRHLLQRMMDMGSNKFPEISRFMLPVLCGFVKTITSSINQKKFHYTLITRKHNKRVGTRYHSRGIDEQGNVSNFIETEQIFSLQVPSHPTTQIRSYVQIRGSIPVFWSQRINSRYTPLLEIYRKPNSTEVFLKHCNDQCQLYGNSLTMINLINKKGYELPLGNEFKFHVDRSRDERIKYIHFDFHKECRKMRYDRVSLLMDSLQPMLKSQGYFSCTLTSGNRAEVHKKQEGVIRTNCIDCLDRTNVVQSAIAKHVLIEQMKELDLLSPGLTSLPADFQIQFNHLWADHADVVSFLYSGTNALKTDFTRFGKRTVQGALKDLHSSIRRYFINNFLDGKRQDAFDLFLGEYMVHKHGVVHRTWMDQVLHLVFVYGVGLSIFIMFLATAMSATSLSQLLQYFFSFVFLLLLCVWLVIHTHGELLVQKPSFVASPSHKPAKKE
ncbi:Phosphoinositide phosphatase sac1 [Coelomomyces lativittatus]|nr:Phosphoinositide phosphatase sac1 [Coelomomyces lativittatus]